MIKHGMPPYLECSSAGEKRLSAFYARLTQFGGRSIEEIYQSAKVFDTGAVHVSWREAKGKLPINIEYVHKLYSELWDLYIEENPILLKLILDASGLSDRFGKPGSCCQATELWRIREKHLHDEDRY